jgi:hypothetical protein
MNPVERKRYDEIDLPYYKEIIAPVLPEEVLDFHAHIWRLDAWLAKNKDGADSGANVASASVTNDKHAKYMVTQANYTVEQIIEDSSRIFPDRPYSAVVFGQPTPAVDIGLTNEYVYNSAKNHKNLYPLIVTGKGMLPADQLKQQLMDCGFMGYKVFLNWVGNDYGHVTVEDMLGKPEMEIANEYSLIVLLHVPRSKRLADPEIQRGIQFLAGQYPQSRIVLAHCGRCYLPDEMKLAIGSIKNLENVYMDTSMVMDSQVMQMVLETIDSKRVLFATDFPVAVMRGRRVYVMDHWVDLVTTGYEDSDFRVASDGIRASYMAYEIVNAIRRGAEMAGLSQKELKDIFYNNGMNLLNNVKHPTR